MTSNNFILTTTNFPSKEMYVPCEVIKKITVELIQANAQYNEYLCGFHMRKNEFYHV